MAEEKKVGLYQDNPNDMEPAPEIKQAMKKSLLKNIIFWIGFWIVVNIILFFIADLSFLGILNYSLAVIGLINIVAAISLYGMSLSFSNEMWQTPLAYFDPHPLQTTEMMNLWSSRTIYLVEYGMGLIFGLILIGLDFLII